MSENGSFSVNGRRVPVQWLGLAVSLAVLLGGIVGVYTSLRADIAENRRAHEDFSREVTRFMERTEKWQAQETAYDTELRSTVAENDRETRTSMRLIAEKLVDLAGKMGR